MPMPKVSIILPIYNGERYLSETISSIFDQSFNDFEVICIDDGSTDSSKEIVFSFDDKRIKYFYQNHTGFPSISRNSGILKTRGEYLTFIDHDDVLRPNSLELRLKKFAERNTQVVYSDCDVIDKNGNQICDSIISFMKKKPLEGDCFRDLFLGNFIPIQGVMIKKNVLKRVGILDKSLFGTDDYNLLLKICYHYPIKFLGRPLASWRHHSISASKAKVRMEEEIGKCLEAVLMLFPDCVEVVGKSNLHIRMYEVCFDAAYSNLEAGNWKNARQWLWKSLLWGKKPKTLLQILEAIGLEKIERFGFTNCLDRYHSFRWRSD
jgi:glycosyltransferase involved in cell wall biosynthesis